MFSLRLINTENDAVDQPQSQSPENGVFFYTEQLLNIQMDFLLSPIQTFVKFIIPLMFNGNISIKAQPFFCTTNQKEKSSRNNREGFFFLEKEIVLNYKCNSVKRVYISSKHLNVQSLIETIR